MSQLVIKDIKQRYLNENSQSVYMLFSVLKKTKDTGNCVNVMPLVKCRDYFSDIVYIQKLKLEDFPETYGFNWVYHKWFDKQVTKDKYTDMLIVIDKRVHETIKQNFLLIHRFETMLGFPLTKFTILEQVTWELEWDTTYTICLHVKVPSKWWSNSILISFYTLLWRLCGYDISPYHDMSFKEIFKLYREDIVGSDSGIISDIYTNYDKFEFFLTEWESLIGNSPQPFSIEYWKENYYDPHDHEDDDYKYRIHNGSGIQSFIQGLKCPNKSELAIRDWCIKFIKEWNDNV